MHLGSYVITIAGSVGAVATAIIDYRSSHRGNGYMPPDAPIPIEAPRRILRPGGEPHGRYPVDLQHYLQS
ncbi:hypothetical protein CHELA20_11283 [Hyphomicrobiales bacterium]|nr:hypothetical protein CHELA20_11283 [Hyphomicrobiales bacterium]CAH1695535.1 hypothetical protein CHELA41_51531 [Hyphomicrobiales bacterium]